MKRERERETDIEIALNRGQKCGHQHSNKWWWKLAHTHSLSFNLNINENTMVRVHVIPLLLLLPLFQMCLAFCCVVCRIEILNCKRSLSLSLSNGWVQNNRKKKKRSTQNIKRRIEYSIVYWVHSWNGLLWASVERTDDGEWKKTFFALFDVMLFATRSL